ncbi:disintegrin and metalloproteinase domain-containing protein 2 isoform X1 [Columba livia]|uniref:disintegrin and metalloproteinase domain-containing protein 2 isoform X1 n=1 Tax=Columba livia TaxID=8932 RepID=UPI0031BAD095
MGPRWALLLLALLLCSPVLPQRVVPRLLPGNTTDELSYVLDIEGRPYTVRLRQHVFLSDDFRIYLSNEKGPLHSGSPRIKGGCYYQGYIEGVPSSIVTLSVCSGLRGLLQFENVTYGIEPLGYSPAFEHFVYRMRDENTAGSVFADSHPERDLGELNAEEMVQALPYVEPLSAEARAPKFFKVYVVLDKALYNHMGSDANAATQKIIQVFSLVNNMFSPLNVTVVLSSLELWTENKIPTEGEVRELLGRFLRWKQSHLTVPSYDIAYLLVYRDQAALEGSATPGGACQREAAGAVAVLQGAVTLESFSILLAQMLGRSLGMAYDRSPRCRCPRPICIMTPAALFFSGAKAFSSCSISDFEIFLKHSGGACLFSRPRLTGLSYRRAPVCGNGVVERGEQCDCGRNRACLKDNCCTRRCRFQPGVQCSSGLCCDKCQLKRQNAPCRPPADAQCDLPELCDGSSASCPPDLYVQDGHDCERGTGYCYKGRCRSPDLQCQRLYGRASRSAPVACYEEFNSQRDRFGHCGYQPRTGFKPCLWRNLRCGKLICTYPYSSPFTSQAAAVSYAKVNKDLCVSLDYFHAPIRLDPLMIPPGTKCGYEKVCINNTCHPHAVLGYDCDSKTKCHGHGVCNNKKHCHCQPGWKPPDCRQWGAHEGGSIDSSIPGLDKGQYRGAGGRSRAGVPATLGWQPRPPPGLNGQEALGEMSLTWMLLGSCTLLLLLVGAVCIVMQRLGWGSGQQRPSSEGSTAEEDSTCSEPEPEPQLEPQLEPGREPDPEAGPERDAGPVPGPRRGR